MSLQQKISDWLEKREKEIADIFIENGIGKTSSVISPSSDSSTLVNDTMEHNGTMLEFHRLYRMSTESEFGILWKDHFKR